MSVPAVGKETRYHDDNDGIPIALKPIGRMLKTHTNNGYTYIFIQSNVVCVVYYAIQ